MTVTSSFIPGDQGLGEGYYTVRVDLNTSKKFTPHGRHCALLILLTLFRPGYEEAGWDLGNFIPRRKRATGIRSKV